MCEAGASTHVESIKTALTFQESDATFIQKFAKDFSVGVYRMSVVRFRTCLCCPQSCRVKRTRQPHKNLSVFD